MTTKHTPGPWNYYTQPQPNGCPIVGSNGLMIAMLAHSVNEPSQKDIAIANARLIAAAPELLEACKTALPSGVCLTNESVPDDLVVPVDFTMGELRKIAEAIAKAEGGAA